MPRWIAPVLIAVLVIGIGALSIRHRVAEAAWHARVEEALKRAAVTDSVAAERAEVAERLEQENAVLVSALEEQGRRTRERVVAVREVEVPDSCAPFVYWRDQIIDELVAEADGWREALENERKVAAALREAYNTAAASNTELVELLESRPRPRARWLPRLGVGAFAGATFDGRPAMGVGLTVSWEV